MECVSWQISKERNQITKSFVSKDTAERLYNAEKLPESMTGDVQIVHIDDYDTCPCIGKHVSSTAGIGVFRITTTSIKDGQLQISLNYHENK